MCVVTALLIVAAVVFVVVAVRTLLEEWREDIEHKVREEMNNG